MKLYVPMRKDNAVLPLNAMSGIYYSSSPNSSYLHSIEAFHRRKDAQAYIDDFNKDRKYPIAMKIVTFTS